MARFFPRQNAAYSVTALQDDISLVAAVPGKRIRVLGLAINSSSVPSASLGKFIFRSIGSATSAITASLNIGSSGLVWPVTPYHTDGWFQTALGDALFFSTTAASAGIQIVYVEV